MYFFVFVFQRGQVNRHLSQGHLSLSGLQLRGHAMFSGMDRPPDCETLEYAWLVEIQLGVLSGKLTLPQVCLMMHELCCEPGGTRYLKSMTLFSKPSLGLISCV